MKILNFSKKEGIIELRPHSLNDLWHISKIISRGDIVSSHSSRKVKLEGLGERSRAERQAVYVKVEVEKVTFDHHAEALRIQGSVKEAPSSVPLLSSHTLTIEKGMELKIQKQWRQHQLDRLYQAEKASNLPSILVLSFDDEEAVFSTVSDIGVKTLATLELNLATKARVKGHEKEKDAYAKLYLQLESLYKQIIPGVIVVASPGFWKDDFFKIVKQKSGDLTKLIKLEKVSSGAHSVKELLGGKLLDKLSSESRLQQEVNYVEEVKKALAKGSAAVYGLRDVKEAAASVRVLLVNDDRLDEADEVIDLVEKAGGRVLIINSDGEAGRELKGLRGIAALL